MPEGARILFLGSFPPQAHRWSMPFYYPNWINDFWRIMGLIYFGDKDHFTIIGEKRFNEADIRAFCTEHRLAFYDTATEVRRLKDNASDAFLEVITPTDIPALLKRIPLCRTLVTTGQKATEVVAQAFGCPLPPVGEWITLRLEPSDPSAGKARGTEGEGAPAASEARGTGGDISVAAGDGQQLRAPGSRWLKEIGFSGTVPKNIFIQPQGEQLLPQEGRLPEAYIDAALADFKEYYSAHIDVHTRPYPGMQELLRELQAKGVKMAVASNKFQEGTEHLIREFFPDIQFVAILGNRPGYPLKPDPEIVREVLAKAAARSGVEDGNGDKYYAPGLIGPEDTIMVGDSPTDMLTAANGGIDAVAVSWGYRTEEELAGHPIAHSIEELRRLLCFT